uniref:Cytochrome C family protein n=1 Tax=Simulacricoccus ruber TaxID=2303410 RepID=A0A3Q8I203_9BACT|nr:cytochrome C family protein [Simulacricoccus ruber]
MPRSPEPTRREAEGAETRHDRRSGRGMRRAIYAGIGGLVLFWVVIVLADIDVPGLHRSRPDRTVAAAQARGGAAATPATGKDPGSAPAFTPPSENDIPPGPAGDAIRRGMQILTNTRTHAGQFVGNDLACTNCHLDAGRRPGSAPMWAAWVSYPMYRAKNKQINTMEDRIKGCFTYSMNAQDSPSGGPPKAGDGVYKDLQMYLHWLATGAPTNTKLEGAGYPKLKETPQGHSPERGRAVFETYCTACHGADGQGQRDINGRVVFPPLWGPRSFNWGAGMASIDNAAGFIKANMPLGQRDRLTDQQAWDVAAYIDSKERPKDPRQSGTVAEAAQQFHSGGNTYYGQVVNGRLLGTGTPAPPTRKAPAAKP